MSYIYDILLNFHEQLFDFYDWNKSDNIIHIKRIPLLKISSNKLTEIINSEVIFNNDLLEIIDEKTEVYTNRKTRIIKYACLLTDGLRVIGINVGKNNQYSKLLLDEEYDVLEVSSRLKESCISYQIINKKEKNNYRTRKEIEQKQKALKELNLIIKKDNPAELKYLYYDCFNEKTDNIEFIKDVLYEKVLSGEIINEVNSFINLKKCIKR